MNDVDALSFEATTKLDRLFDSNAVLFIVDHGKPDAQRGLTRNFATNVLYDSDKQLDTVFERPAIFIATFVGERRQEICNEVTVTCMNLDQVEACLHSAHCGICEVDHHLIDFGDGHGHRLYAILSLDFAPRNIGSGLDGRRTKKFLPTAVRELHANLGSRRMHLIDQPSKPRHMLAMRIAQLAMNSLGRVIINIGLLGHDQACATFGQPLVMIDRTL